MAAPYWKVFNPRGEYVAACKLPEDAAAIIAAYGPGATLRAGHAKKETVWTEGVDGVAGESYDAVGAHAREALRRRSKENARQAQARYDERMERLRRIRETCDHSGPTTRVSHPADGRPVLYCFTCESYAPLPEAAKG